MAAADTLYMTPLPSHPPPPYADSDMDSLNSHNPYRRFLSPSPSKPSLRRQRSTSVPSVAFNGNLEHQPMEPIRRRQTPSWHGPPPARRSSRASSRRYSHQPPREAGHLDIIDRLDDAGFLKYHHEGPYDAVYSDRNNNTKHSPLEAVKESNAEALRATPADKITDCINSRRPLDGVAFYPPGTTDGLGQTYEYEEGTNMMNDYGNFMRVPGMKFTDEDFKNDPFYNSPLPRPFASLKKKFSLKRRSRRGTA